jgi:hypothetical protein
MQRVAEQMHFTKMAVYRYVPGRPELVALMTDRAVGLPPGPRTRNRKCELNPQSPLLAVRHLCVRLGRIGWFTLCRAIADDCLGIPPMTWATSLDGFERSRSADRHAGFDQFRPI